MSPPIDLTNGALPDQLSEQGDSKDAKLHPQSSRTSDTVKFLNQKNRSRDEMEKDLRNRSSLGLVASQHRSRNIRLAAKQRAALPQVPGNDEANKLIRKMQADWRKMWAHQRANWLRDAGYINVKTIKQLVESSIIPESIIRNRLNGEKVVDLPEADTPNQSS